MKDPKILSQRYLPEKLWFLDDQKRDLGIYLGYILKDNVPPNIILIGPRGTGKTTLALTFKRELENLVEEKGLNIKIGFAHAPNTAYSAFIQLANDVGIELPEQGISYESSIVRYEKACSDSTSIFIIDEIDKIRDINELILQLSKRNDLNAGIKGYCIIGITNKQRFMSTIDNRNLSSFNHRIINTHQILSDRVNNAFYENALETGVLGKISAHAAKRKGDCRFGLDVLLQGAELAEKNQSSKLTMEITDKAIDVVEFQFIYDNIKKKTLTQQYLLLKTAIDQRIHGTQLYQWYAHVLGKDALSSRRITEYINELVDDQFIEKYNVRTSTGKQSWLKLFELEPYNVIVSIATDNFLNLYGGRIPDTDLDVINKVKDNFKLF